MTARGLCAAVLGLLLLVAVGARAEEPAGPAPRLSAATAAFRAGTAAESSEARVTEFHRAATLFEEALTAGPPNGALEYNAGNAWLLAGDVGRAILHYRRALELRPGDPRIEANLETARGRRRDQFETTSSRALTDTLVFWHRGLSLRSKIPVALTAWMLAFALLATGVWLPRRRVGRAGARRAGLMLLVVALAVGVSAIVEIDARDGRDAAVVLAEDVVLRTGDGASYPARYENPIHAGAEVRIVEERAGWADVELADGKRGWLRVDAVERI